MISTYEKQTDIQTLSFTLRSDEVTGIVLVSFADMTVESSTDEAARLELSLLDQGFTRIWHEA